MAIENVSFKDDEQDIREYAKKRGFSNYVKNLIREDMDRFKPSKNMEEYIINLIQKYAPNVTKEEIEKQEFDPDKRDNLSQFGEM